MQTPARMQLPTEQLLKKLGALLFILTGLCLGALLAVLAGN